MSRVHDAMRRIARKSVSDLTFGSPRRNLVGALIEELADEIPDDAGLEMVKADLLGVVQTAEASGDNETPLRFYLAMRALLREYAALQDRLKKFDAVEVKPPSQEPPEAEASATAAQ
jgi:hypothetical protein